MFEDGRPLAVRSEPMAKGHQERIGSLVRDVVAEAGDRGFAAVDRIGVTVGPGSFTGLRVGLAFAQGLGAALDRPVIGISTLAALAWSADGGVGRTAAVIDARRGQVYIQQFNDGAPLGDPEALTIEAARGRLVGDDGRRVGSGAGLVVDPAEGDPALTTPTPAALAILTAAADPASAPPRPLYLRAPDATPPTRLPGQPRPARP
jgi:tRNA threonylcarbamoyladenosine biosynthesis protein TsaB